MLSAALYGTTTIEGETPVIEDLPQYAADAPQFDGSGLGDLERELPPPPLLDDFESPPESPITYEAAVLANSPSLSVTSTMSTSVSSMLVMTPPDIELGAVAEVGTLL